MPGEITSRHNSRVARVRALFTRKERTQQGLAILEGVRAIDEALDGGAEIQEVLLVEPAVHSLAGGTELIERLNLAGVKLVRVAADLANEISDTENPQGVTAVVRIRHTSLPAVFDSPGTMVLVLAGLQDPGNMGTIIRSAACLGAQGIVALPGTVDAYNPKVLRSTAGALFRLPLAEATVDELVQLVCRRGVRLLVTATEGATASWQLDWSKPIALVIGNEARGVPQELVRLSHGAVTIPMSSSVDSLNAAMAATILLYEAWRARH